MLKADNYREKTIDASYLSSEEIINSSEFSVIFMRKDPPVDDLYITVTQTLALCEQYGSKIVNPPQMLQSLNEKIHEKNFSSLFYSNAEGWQIFTTDGSSV